MKKTVNKLIKFNNEMEIMKSKNITKIGNLTVHKVYCSRCNNDDHNCPACGDKGYNIVVFKKGMRIF
jgi:hypothetical protein